MNELTHEGLLGGMGRAIAIEDLLRHGTWIRGFCRSLAGPGDGDDLAQETWLVALRRPERAARVERARPWLASVARRLAFDRWKGPARRLETGDGLDALADESPLGRDTAEVVQESELAHVVAGEVLALSEPNRTTLLLRYFEGLDAAAIAGRLGVPASTVRSRIRRGLEDVRAALDRRHGGQRERWLGALLPIVRPASTRSAWLVPAGVTLVVASLSVGLVARAGAGASAIDGGAPGAETTSSARVAALVPLAQDDEEPSARQPVEQKPQADADPVNLVAPRVRWHHPSGQHAPPLVVGDRIVSVGQELACLAADDGTVIWKLAETGSYWVGPPAHDDGRLIVTHATGAVACFALDDGRTVWQQPYEEVLASGQPCSVVRTADGSTVLVGTKSGVAALRAADGERLWSIDLGSEVQLRPASDGVRVLAGTRAGAFCALDVADGSVLWRHESGAQYGWTNPVVADGVAYVGDRGKGGTHRKEDGGKLVTEVDGNRGGALNAFDVETGELLWGRIFGATGLSEPFVTRTHVWVGFGSVVVPFAREDGSVREEDVLRTGRNAFGSPRVLGDQVVFGNLDGHLYVHDRASRERLWNFAPTSTKKAQVGGWTAAHGRLYVSTTAGLFALEDPPNAEPVAPGTSIVSPDAPTSPESTAEDAPVVEAPRFESALELANRWIERIAPRKDDGTLDEARVDPLERQAALDEVRAALEGTDVARLHAALRTVAGIQEAVDVTDLRWLVEPHARNGAVILRVSALYALWAVGPAPGGTRADDLPLVHAAWDAVDAESRLRLPHLLAMFGEGRIEGRSEELVLSLLAEPDSSFRQWINGLWGARVGHAIAGRLVELTTDPELEPFAYDAFYYALSTLADKTPAVVDVLLDALAQRDPNWSQRAVWGLGHGVPKELHARVADGVLARWPRLGEPIRERAKRLVETYGTPAQVEALDD